MSPSTTARRPCVLLAGRPPIGAEAVVELVTELLAAEHCDVHPIPDGQAAAEAVRSGQPDLAIVTDTVATLDPADLIRRLRRRDAETPIALLTTCGDEAAAVTYLEAGADDVLLLPLGPALLRARLRVLLRRTPQTTDGVITVGDVTVDRERRAVTRAGQPVDLTLTEFDVLELLVRNADIVLSRVTIYERLWGADLHESSKSLDVHVGGLRHKLEAHGDRMIHNVRGVGYVIWTNGAPNEMA